MTFCTVSLIKKRKWVSLSILQKFYCTVPSCFLESQNIIVNKPSKGIFQGPQERTSLYPNLEPLIMGIQVLQNWSPPPLLGAINSITITDNSRINMYQYPVSWHVNISLLTSIPAYISISHSQETIHQYLLTLDHNNFHPNWSRKGKSGQYMLLGFSPSPVPFPWFLWSGYEAEETAHYKGLCFLLVELNSGCYLRRESYPSTLLLKSACFGNSKQSLSPALLGELATTYTV